MTETQVGFLYNIASAVSRSENETTNTFLKSYYLMRCKNITRGYGLPEKHFSSNLRCPKCCIEWKSNTKVNVQSIKLSKRQKQRLKSRKIKESNKDYVRNRNNLLHSNEVEQICSFCNKSYKTPALKPLKPELEHSAITTGQINSEQFTEKDKTNISLQKTDSKKSEKKPEVKVKEINVYANSLDVFSIQNKNNALKTKEKPKVINNNKRRKDKFAGLCQKAVLASARMKEKKDKQNKLNLFLKPSS